MLMMSKLRTQSLTMNRLQEFSEGERKEENNKTHYKASCPKRENLEQLTFNEAYFYSTMMRQILILFQLN